MSAGSAANDVGANDDVVRRAQRGDVDAFEMLYRRHAPSVYALCRRMVSDDREATELVQEAFVRAWERLRSFRGESAFGTWLHRVAVNVVLERGRVSAREGARLLDAGDDSVADGRSGEGELDARMDIENAVARLPAGARVVFVLHDMHGYSHDEIARMTGVAASTARVQLWRARRALMRMLDR